MERVTISLEESLLAEFDRYIARKGYQNRSEAIRDLVRDRLETEMSRPSRTWFAFNGAGVAEAMHAAPAAASARLIKVRRSADWLTMFSPCAANRELRQVA